MPFASVRDGGTRLHLPVLTISEIEASGRRNNSHGLREPHAVWPEYSDQLTDNRFGSGVWVARIRRTCRECSILCSRPGRHCRRDEPAPAPDDRVLARRKSSFCESSSGIVDYASTKTSAVAWRSELKAWTPSICPTWPPQSRRTTYWPSIVS